MEEIEGKREGGWMCITEVSKREGGKDEAINKWAGRRASKAKMRGMSGSNQEKILGMIFLRCIPNALLIMCDYYWPW